MPSSLLLYRIDHIEKRERAATPGPWFPHNAQEPGGDLWYYVSPTAGPGKYEWRPEAELLTSFQGFVAVTHHDSYDSTNLKQAQADTQFIAHCRHDVPWMATTIRSQVHLIDGLKSLNNRLTGENNRLEADNHIANDRIAKLQAQLDACAKHLQLDQRLAGGLDHPRLNEIVVRSVARLQAYHAGQPDRDAALLAEIETLQKDANDDQDLKPAEAEDAPEA